MDYDGYAKQILRVDLSRGAAEVEELDEQVLEKWVGGVGLGAYYLYKEVPANIRWNDPENRIVWTTGPLAGSGVYGAGTFNVAALGPMTNLAGCSQANGYFGAYLKFSGFDGIIFQGKAPDLVFVEIKEGKAKIHSAGHLSGMDTLKLEDALREKLGVKNKDVSIFGIGPAGENQVYYANIVGDQGHTAAHNGLGAVMGAKNVKAVVVHRTKKSFSIHDPQTLKEKNIEMFEHAKKAGPVYEWGTGGTFSTIHDLGCLPVKNYTTNIFPEHDRMNGQYLRTNFEIWSKPCYMCRLAHVKMVKVTEGPYKGFIGEEPEYEQMAAWGPQIGNTDLGAVVMLANEVDRLGIDCNESAWVIGWVMECYDKGIFTEQDLDGLRLEWGNVEAVRELLGKISRKEGIGALLAKGVMRASQEIGGEAAECAVYSQKGAAPRSHDHRGKGRWFEMLDTCLSNTSTLEVMGSAAHPNIEGYPSVKDPFDGEEVSTLNAKYSGIRMFDDCLGTCRFCCTNLKLQLDCVNAVTGWNMTMDDAFTVGRRVINLLRLFNFRHGLDPKKERPSKRYGSVPIDGPAKGIEVMEGWDSMVKKYRKMMGWDPESGKPLKATLIKLDMEEYSEEGL